MTLALRPVEHTGLRGTAYTVVYIKEDPHASVLDPASDPQRGDAPRGMPAVRARPELRGLRARRLGQRERRRNARAPRTLAGDPRLKLLRQDEPLGVTDNWNRALVASSGERIGLLGDDDVLLPGYFERADALLEKHADPDVLLFNAVAFAFPGFAGSSESAYADPFYVPAAPLPADGPLPKPLRRGIVEDLFRFNFPIPLNMQIVLVTRSAMEQLPHGLFKPPFPDFYALVRLMLSDVDWAVSPERLAVVGVSPKSFGRTVHSSTSTDSARNYLGIDLSFQDRLPGSEVMNGHYETLMVLKADFAEALRGVEIDRSEYAWQQAYSWYVQRRLGSLTTRDVVDRLRMLRGDDWIGLSRLLAKRQTARCRRCGRGCARFPRSTTSSPSRRGSRRTTQGK